MSDEDAPRVLRDVKLVSYGPDLTGMGEIVNITEPLPGEVPSDEVREAVERASAHQVPAIGLVHGDCGYGIVPEPWHHEYGPPMIPGDRCER